MHFIQNNWFAQNWIWVLFVLLFASVVVLYINNKEALIKKAIFSLVLFFILSVSFTVIKERNFSLNNKMSLLEITQEKVQSEAPSILSSIFNYLYERLLDKMRD